MVTEYVKEFDLIKGNRVRISLPDGYSAEGVVISAEFYDRDGWYIELDKDLSTEKNRPSYLRTSSYGYYKQGSDGGKVEKL